MESSSNSSDQIPEQSYRVLVIDDEPANVALLETIIQQDPRMHVTTTIDSRETISLVNEYQPDIILLDLKLPYLDGYAVLELLLSGFDDEDFLPIIVLTADATKDAMRRALSSGATDFLTKPFDPTEILLRMHNHLHTRELNTRLREYGVTLESRVSERTEQLEHAKLELLERLARTTEYRDDTTGEHTQRVGVNAALLWHRLGLPESDAQVIERAAPLHDIGKVGIPDSILLKPGSLTPDEFEFIKRHTTIGSDILHGSEFSVLQMGERIARSHHECWDGSGYPDGLTGTSIPIGARIVKVCDVFDALTSVRPYKGAIPSSEALLEIEAMAESQGDPDIVHAFCDLFTEGAIVASDRE